MKKLVKIFIFLLICCVLYFSYLQVKIMEHSKLKATEKVDYIIILGARVKGSVPSLALQNRIDTAAEYLKNNKGTIAIASGGKGKGEDISEAEAIKRGLVLQGITPSRIYLEDKSTDTVENIRLSKKLIPTNLKTGLIVTNDFHLYRAMMIAEDHGLQVASLPAKTPAIAIPKSYSREYLAITKYFLESILRMKKELE